MGRTRRKRSRRPHRESTVSTDQSIINLQKWMNRNGWKNDTKLTLRSFPDTGRGLSSKYTVHSNDVLITIPFEIMITYATCEKHLADIISPGSKLTMHELLSLFLVYETRKKDISSWRYYIDSLPKEPPHLPWHNQSNELQEIGRMKQEEFVKSLNNVRNSIKHEVLPCIEFNEDLFRWAYVMVNTRAVHVDPSFIGRGDFSVDEPSLALCPFLDMFNHHYTANTEAKLNSYNGKLVYQLKSLSSFKKNTQIFISYGNHNSKKLLMEYGFFIPRNIHDVIELTFEEVSVILDVKLSQAKYRYICSHLFKNDLYLSYEGPSFNLRALLFVWLCEESDEKYLNSIIFSDSYPLQFFSHLPALVRSLLKFKQNVFEKEYASLSCQSKNDGLVEQYLLCRLTFLSDIIDRYGGQ